MHLLKCIRNNWISEKCQKLSLNDETVASFSDVVDLYKEEKDNILKTTSLTLSSVFPSKLKLQNVQHVLKVFNDRVVAAHRLKGACDSANFIKFIFDWWNTVNVSAHGQNVRLRGSSRQKWSKLSNFCFLLKKCLQV